MNGYLSQSFSLTGEVMQAFGRNVDESDIYEKIKEVDIDGNGTIEFSEFVTMAEKSKKTVDSEESIKEMFSAFDLNGDGFIDAEELRKMLLGLGETFTDKDIDAMMLEADIDGDGRVNYEEFVKIMSTK